MRTSATQSRVAPKAAHAARWRPAVRPFAATTQKQGGAGPRFSYEKLPLQAKREAGAVEGTAVPPIVHEVLRTSGQPLDAGTRASMERPSGHDFSQVRVHTDATAEESASVVHARAYTQGEHIVFARGRYAPSTTEGRRLVGHELAHVVQQSAWSHAPQTAAGDDLAIHADPTLEAEADRVGDHAARAEPAPVLGTPPSSAGAQLKAQQGSIQLDPDDSDQKPPVSPTDQTAPASPTTPTPTASPTDQTAPASPTGQGPTAGAGAARQATVSVSWDALLQPGALQLTPPSLLAPTTPGPQSPRLPSPGTLTLDGSGQAASPTGGPALLGAPAGLSSDNTAAPAAAPAMPSRLPIPGINTGRLSLGLSLGFPTLTDPSGMAPSAAQAALSQAAILNEIVTGQVPTMWQAVDKGKLAGVIWSIFSTHIAPGFAQQITSSLSSPTGPAGASYQLDLLILSDFSGAGVSFTANW
jgi:hypothetical protein